MFLQRIKLTQCSTGNRQRTIHKMLCFISSFTFLWIPCLASIDQPLNGLNIRVMPLPMAPFLEIERNATSDRITSMSGVANFILGTLAETLNFTVDINHALLHSLSDSPTTKGGIYYLLNKEVDMLLGPVIMTYKRQELMDFPYAFMISQLGLLIPMPGRTVNGISAVWQPLQNEVWLCFAISLAIVLVFMFTFFKRTFFYVFEVLLSQGGFCRKPTLALYVLSGTWCWACFVLVTAYSSVLISFLTAPVYEPLITSVNDLARKTYIHPVIQKGKAVDALLQSADDGVGKFVINLLSKDPNFRCVTPEQCLEKINAGSTVFVQIKEIIMDQIGREFKKTGRCDFAIAKQTFMDFQVGLSMIKNSPFTEAIGKELLKMEAAGLIDQWWKWATTDPTRCLDMARSRPVNPRLKLKGLSGAFVVLAFGSILAFLACLVENVVFRRYR